MYDWDFTLITPKDSDVEEARTGKIQRTKKKDLHGYPVS
jgi:hypothetical protein